MLILLLSDILFQKLWTAICARKIFPLSIHTSKNCTSFTSFNIIVCYIYSKAVYVAKKYKLHAKCTWLILSILLLSDILFQKLWTAICARKIFPVSIHTSKNCTSFTSFNIIVCYIYSKAVYVAKKYKLHAKCTWLILLLSIHTFYLI